MINYEHLGTCRVAFISPQSGVPHEFRGLRFNAVFLTNEVLSGRKKNQLARGIGLRDNTEVARLRGCFERARSPSCWMAVYRSLKLLTFSMPMIAIFFCAPFFYLLRGQNSAGCHSNGGRFRGRTRKKEALYKKMPFTRESRLQVSVLKCEKNLGTCSLSSFFSVILFDVSQNKLKTQ